LEKEIGYHRALLRIIVLVERAAESKAKLAQPGQDLVSERLTRIQLDIAAFDVQIINEGQRLTTAFYDLQLIALDIDLEQAGRTYAVKAQKVVESTDTNRLLSCFSRAEYL
jgi:hypothetical protein